MDELERLEDTATRKIHQEMREIYDIWCEIGLNSVQQQERVNTAWDHIHTLVQDIKNEEVALCEELKSKIRSLTENISYLSDILSMELPQVSGLTLLQRLEALEQGYSRLNDMKEQRMKDLEELRIVEKNYCELLVMEEYKLSSTTEVPSEEDLLMLRQHINMLREEQVRRYEKYCQAKRQLSTILEVTEAAPETPLEKLICSDKEPVSLSKSTLQEIEDAIARARSRKEELEMKKNTLVKRLNLLWDRLNIEDELRFEFMENHLDCKASTLEAIQQEVDKYEEMKKQNLSLFIDSVRRELAELWVKCGASDCEKQMFDTCFTSTDATDGILTIHEDEVERWRKYYEEVRHILEKIDKRNKLWEHLKALDNKANDKERYKNRGGNLLKEEKERNKLLRSLPALEKEIKEAIDKYEVDTRKQFLYLGEDYRIVICNQWNERTNSKENLKVDKCSTPSKRVLSATPKKSPFPKFSVYRSGKTPRSIKKRELDVLKEVASNLNDNPSCSNATSYPDFETELNRTARKSLRSSVVASKKIGGTRTPMSCKKKMISKKRTSVGDELTSVGGKAGLPFLM